MLHYTSALYCLLLNGLTILQLRCTDHETGLVTIFPLGAKVQTLSHCLPEIEPHIEFAREAIRLCKSVLQIYLQSCGGPLKASIFTKT